MLKWLNANVFYDQNMVDQTQQYLISPFCDDKYFTTAAHFRFQYESLPNQFEAFLFLFFNFQFAMITLTSSGNEYSLKNSMPCYR